jgi:hypothetical protein
VSALRRFAMSITALTVVGLFVLGFEQAYATPVVAVLAAYLTELTLETIEARTRQRPARYQGGPVNLIDFLLPAHITGLACAMLLYANSATTPVIFAAVTAIASKYVIRVTLKGRARHVLNPSNTGIVLTLILFGWVGIAPPYQFTEWVSGPVDWIIPGAILVAGTMLNAQLTKKMPLIIGWVTVFALQAVVRTSIEHTSTTTALLVMTGTAFVLFTNYMITDPGSTPVRPWRQFAFGASTGVTYGLLVYFHVVFGLFFALFIVSSLRAMSLMVVSWRQRHRSAAPPATGNQAKTANQANTAKTNGTSSTQNHLDLAALLLNAAAGHLDAAADELNERQPVGVGVGAAHSADDGGDYQAPGVSSGADR